MPHAPADPADPQDALGPLDPVEQILGDCLAQPEDDWDGALEQACRAHPQHAATLRRRFSLLRGAGLAAGDSSERQRDLAVVRDLAESEPEVAHALAEAMGVDAASVPGLRARPDPRLGTSLRGRYRLDDRLGAGAMGVVYTAHDLELRRDVAVKILDGSLLGSPKAEARFLQEAELLAALRHDAIVGVYDRGLGHDGELFLVMERLEGAPLTQVLDAVAQARVAGGDPLAAVRELLAAPPPPEPGVDRLAVRWAAELAEGLAAAHAAGILHRDVKPSNVFIRRDWRAVLLDFGIATRGADLTAAGTVLGTPSYMAPEQAIPGARLTPALDVYGVGACLYHLLTRRPPFEGEPLAVVAKIAHEDPPRPSTLRADLPRDLDAILETAMARATADRYRDAHALAVDLRAFLAHQPVTARPLSALARAWRRTRRRPARAALAVAVAVAAVLAIVMVPLAARERARARAEARFALETRLPALLAFEGDPSQRLLEAVRPENLAYLADLDALVDLDPNDIPTRLWRAALRLDDGDHAGAAADLDRLATVATTPYLRAVAARYATAARDRRGTEAVDLGDLGSEPTSAADCFVAGFHELRNRHITGFAARADALLERAAATYLPARDLRLIALVARGDFERKPDCLELAIAESLRLEGVYGRATARTCAMRGAALVLQGRYAEAIAPLEESLRLRPDRHGPLQNLGIAHRRLNDLAKASEYLARAGAVRPHFWNTVYTQAQILKDHGDYAAAWKVAEGLAETGAAGAEWKKPYLLANIAVQELCALYRAQAERTQLDAVAARAIAQFDLTAARAGASLQPRIAATKALAHALTAGDADEACARLLAQLASDPQDPFQIGNVASLLPSAGLSSRATTYLRLYLAALATKLAPQDARQQEYLREALRAVDRLNQITHDSPPPGSGR